MSGGSQTSQTDKELDLDDFANDGDGLDNEAVGEESEGLDLGGEVDDPGAEPEDPDSDAFLQKMASGTGLEFENDGDGVDDGDEIDVSSFLGDLSNITTDDEDDGDDEDEDEPTPAKKSSSGGGGGAKSSGSSKKKSSGGGSGGGGRKTDVPKTAELDAFAQKMKRNGMSTKDAVIKLAEDFELTTSQITAFLNAQGVKIVYQSVRSTLMAKGLHRSVQGEKLVDDSGTVLKPRSKKGETAADIKKQIKELLGRLKAIEEAEKAGSGDDE